MDTIRKYIFHYLFNDINFVVYMLTFFGKNLVKLYIVQPSKNNINLKL
jgi:hypothetical protein